MAQGFKQEYGMGYDETLLQLVKDKELSYSAAYAIPVSQMNVSKVFLI